MVKTGKYQIISIYNNDVYKEQGHLFSPLKMNATLPCVFNFDLD
jgi:hypothetical protein